MVERNAEGPELGLVPTGAEPEHQSPAADLLNRGRLSGQQPGRAEARARYEGPQPNPIGHGRERAEETPRVPRTALLAAIVPVEEVVAEPDRVEADVFGRTGHGGVLRPRHLTLDLGKLHPNAHLVRRGHS